MDGWRYFMYCTYSREGQLKCCGNGHTGLWDVCSVNQRKCKHCLFQTKPLSSCLQAALLFLQGQPQYLSAWGMATANFCMWCLLWLWAGPPSNLRLTDLSALLPWWVLWWQAPQQLSFLVVLLRRLSHFFPFLRSPPQAVTRNHDSPLKVSVIVWRSAWTQTEFRQTTRRNTDARGPGMEAQPFQHSVFAALTIWTFLQTVSICHLLDAPVSFLMLIPSGYSSWFLFLNCSNSTAL